MYEKTYKYDEQNDLFVYENAGTLNYSDGSEKYFIDLFTKIDNANPVELQKFIKDWPTRYHLSIMRSNILESVANLLNKDGEVLELGGGIGAVTGWFADNFKNVDVIEGSLNRAKALRLRTRNKDNVRVLVGDIAKVEYPREHYDLISLIGVLEYLPFYSNVAPYKVCLDFLKKVNKNFHENGILVIAIENKLGAKYFSGCTEDHNSELFSGIMDYPKKSPITFSRNELEDLLKESGFTNIQFYHMFPDYKLPVLFFREDPAIYETNPSLFARGLFPDYSGKREFLFSEPLFLESIYKARLLHHFSNSFLVLCSNSGKVNLKTDWIVKKFWNKENTRPEFHHTIQFLQKDNKLLVERKPLANGKETFTIEDIQFQLKSEVFVQGTSLLLLAYRSVIEDQSYSGLITILNNVLSNLKQQYGLKNVDEEGYEYIDGAAIDYCLWNIVQDDASKLHFIDQKWKYLKAITADFVIFRSIIGLYGDVYPFIQESNLSDFVIRIMKKLFPKYNEVRFKYNLNMEEDFEKQVYKPEIIIKNNGQIRKNIVDQIKKLKEIENQKMLVILERLLVTGNVYIWGAGTHTINLLNVFNKMKFPLDRITGIVDSNPDKNNTIINGIPVFSKDNFQKNKCKECTNIIISSKSFEDEIYSDLQNLFGDEINIIRLYHNGLNVDLLFEQ
ncbi:MAG: methyltransferase domain-containing protein [Firmicutes bacterium]|nr:methyltransferase domain-containing protein [Bacillota bacterium]